MDRAERSDRDGARDDPQDGDRPPSYEAWKRRLEGSGPPWAVDPPLSRVLKKMVSLSELMGKLEEEASAALAGGKDELFIVAGRGRRSTLSLETLDRWIDLESGLP